MSWIRTTIVASLSDEDGEVTLEPLSPESPDEPAPKRSRQEQLRKLANFNSYQEMLGIHFNSVQFNSIQSISNTDHSGQADMSRDGTDVIVNLPRAATITRDNSFNGRLELALSTYHNLNFTPQETSGR